MMLLIHVHRHIRTYKLFIAFIDNPINIQNGFCWEINQFEVQILVKFENMRSIKDETIKEIGKMKKFFIDNGGSLSMLLALGTLVFDDFFGEYLQPFENLLLNIITYIIIVLLNLSFIKRLTFFINNEKVDYWKLKIID